MKPIVRIHITVTIDKNVKTTVKMAPLRKWGKVIKEEVNIRKIVKDKDE